MSVCLKFYLLLLSVWFQVIIYYVGINIKISISHLQKRNIYVWQYDSYLKKWILQNLNHLLLHISFHSHSFLLSHAEKIYVQLYILQHEMRLPRESNQK